MTCANEPYTFLLCPPDFQPPLRGPCVLSGLAPADAHPFDMREVLDVYASVGTELEVPNVNNGITPVGIFGRLTDLESCECDYPGCRA